MYEIRAPAPAGGVPPNPVAPHVAEGGVGTITPETVEQAGAVVVVGATVVELTVTLEQEKHCTS